MSSLPPDAVSLADYARLAQQHLDPAALAYLNGGAADEVTLGSNLAAWRSAEFIPRVLAPPNSVDTSVSLFGNRFPSPILIAPTAYHRLFHPDGELATAAAANALQVPYIVSTQASCHLEDIAHHSENGTRWFQLYIQPDRAFTAELIKKAEHTGHTALVLTIDAPLNGLRNTEQRAGFYLPPHITAVNLLGVKMPSPPSSALDPSFLSSLPTWSDLAWLRSLTSLPILLKGILHPEDARLAIEHGADGIIVSNHGGRTLDQAISTRHALPPIIEAVNDRIPVLVDGGIRRGSDILQALALGAKAVLIGRPILHGLSVAGAAGVAHVLRLLQHELEVSILLTGCQSLDPKSLASVLHSDFFAEKINQL